MDATLAATEAFLHQQIPITSAMGVKVAAYDEAGLLLTAPLEENHNHLGTAFGGSISSLATLAGYALLWLELGDHTAHIVIRSSSLSYQKPIRGDLHALCHHPLPDDLTAFKARLEKSGKARISLTVTLSENGTACATYQGEYVALR